MAAVKVQLRAASLPGLLSAARANAFDVRIRQVEFAQQGFKVALSKNERYPAISIGPFYSMENAIEREQRAGLGVSLPLPLWDRNVGNIATSKARQQQAEASLAMAQRDVERRVAQSAAIFTAKRAEIDNLKGDELAKFRDAAETADRNYRLGAVPLTIYVETQKQYLDLVGTLTELQKDALQAAQELEILTGFKLYGDEAPR
jgi:cobalt-zinc-cadmium efflux system outer membrane protein